MEFVIQCVNDETLFWSNEFGWTDSDDFDIFTLQEKKELNLPIEGIWVDFPIYPSVSDL